jgi:AraC family transcriptional activator of pobA
MHADRTYLSKKGKIVLRNINFGHVELKLAYFHLTLGMNHIPVHSLQDRTKHGLQIKYFNKDEPQQDDVVTLGAHRDDHYIFFLLEDGLGSLMIDFSEVQLSGMMLYYVLPAQVHHRIRNEAATGWFIAVDTSLIPRECRNVFESQLSLQQPYPLHSNELRQCHELLMLLTEKQGEEISSPFYTTIVHSLLQSFIGIVAGCYSQHTGLNLNLSRSAQLSAQFKRLLSTELHSKKGPAEYAEMLNISESYLSESLKKHTGFHASYWIQQEVMMEAKRLLYYSELTVKEIAHHLGYSDHSYFCRLFRKVTGIPAMAFRKQYRK